MKKKLKILFISHSSAMVGAERSLLLLLKNIDRDCFNPIVILPASGSLKGEIEYLNIKTYEVKSPWWVSGWKRNVIWTILRFGYSIIREVMALLKLYKIVEKEKIDMIYTNTIVNFSGAIIAFITKKPHIWHIREIIPDNPDLHFFLPDRWLFNFILRYSNKVITNSSATSKQFRNSKLDWKIRIVYNAIDVEEFKIHQPFPSINGVKTTDYVVAVIGSLQKRKAQDDAIKAVKIVKETIPNIKLLIVGEGRKEFKNYLKNLTLKLGISNNIIFTGYRDDIPSILCHCKLLLVPSWNEPFGRVVIEAFATGIPVIGTNSGGVKEIIKDGVTGYLVPPKSPLIIAEKMIYLFHHKNIAKKMGNAGEETVRNKFNAQYYKQNIEKIIMESIF